MDTDEVALKTGIGERMRQERVRLALTPEDFASKVGLHRSTLFNYESGARVPDALALHRMHAALEVDVQYVVCGQRAAPRRMSEADAALLSRVASLPAGLRGVVENVALLASLSFEARRDYDYTAAINALSTSHTDAPSYAVHEPPPKPRR